MSKFLIRLDDAAPKHNIEAWIIMEKLLDKYNIKPIVGVIPNCKDPKFDIYNIDSEFWSKVIRWNEKEWEIALHGYNHVYSTRSGGINPVNSKSEFAGLPYSIQEKKIEKGIQILNGHGINPRIFFAPSHTFDNLTLLALRKKSNINIISDTIAFDVYYRNSFYFIPQQVGRARNIPFKLCTFCYHPNTMKNEDFIKLEKFLKSFAYKFISFDQINLKKRKYTLLDWIFSNAYFGFRIIKNGY